MIRYLEETHIPEGITKGKITVIAKETQTDMPPKTTDP